MVQDPGVTMWLGGESFLRDNMEANGEEESPYTELAKVASEPVSHDSLDSGGGGGDVMMNESDQCSDNLGVTTAVDNTDEDQFCVSVGGSGDDNGSGGGGDNSEPIDIVTMDYETEGDAEAKVKVKEEEEEEEV